jgi:hypothetical protein
MRWILPAAAFLALSGSAAAAGTSGLWGVVTRGPTTPVCRAGVPCSGPAAGVRLVFARGGVVRGRAVTSRAGRYRIALTPGIYAIKLGSSSAGRPGFLHAPVAARVVAGRYRRVDVSIDTGIR